MERAMFFSIPMLPSSLSFSFGARGEDHSGDIFCGWLISPLSSPLVVRGEGRVRSGSLSTKRSLPPFVRWFSGGNPLQQLLRQ